MFNQNHDNRTVVNAKHDPIIADAENAVIFQRITKRFPKDFRMYS